MATRKKKTTRKKTTRKKASRKKTARQRGTQLLKTIDKEMSQLSKVVDKRLAPLRREIEKAERKAGTRGSKLLREARKRLNAVQIEGHSDLTKFLRKQRRELSHALTEIEHSVRPKRKKTTRKKATARA